MWTNIKRFSLLLEHFTTKLIVYLKRIRNTLRDLYVEVNVWQKEQIKKKKGKLYCFRILKLYIKGYSIT